jgi:hypothetical protein
MFLAIITTFAIAKKNKNRWSGQKDPEFTADTTGTNY